MEKKIDWAKKGKTLLGIAFWILVLFILLLVSFIAILYLTDIIPNKVWAVFILLALASFVWKEMHTGE